VKRGEDRLERVARDVIACKRCPRLRRYCLEVATVKRAAYRGQVYWGLPVPGFGDPDARILIVGLAPGAHGANRTGRIFTGDRSGDFLFSSLDRTGLANQPVSRSRDDGLKLCGAYVSAVARCAPPANRPLPQEIRNCLPYLVREILLMPKLRVVVALGGIAFAGVWTAFASLGYPVPRPRPAFGHGVEVPPEEGRPLVLASYHPSQQNTQTGKLTPAMFDAIFARALDLAFRHRK
jgi:uracil-DNA glycosylase family 4